MAGPVSNWLGRRNAIAFACAWWLLGTALQAGCNGIGMLVAGRFINGICVGITSSQVPVYLVEITKKERRGSIVVIQQWAIEWGIFIMYFVGYGCSFIKGPASFRTAWAIQFVPCVCLLAGLPFLPESPRWLARAGRTDQAIQVLADIQAHGDVNDPLVVAEWEEITTVMALERGGQQGWRRFFQKGMWRRTFAGVSTHRDFLLHVYGSINTNSTRRGIADGVPTDVCPSMATAFRRQRHDLLRRLYLRYGSLDRQHQPHQQRYPIRNLHHRHGCDFLLYRRDWSAPAADLRRS